MSRNTKQPKYPWVKCHDGQLHLGYVVCKCIIDRKKSIDHHHPASEKTLGELLCNTKHKHKADDLVLICKECVEKLYLN